MKRRRCATTIPDFFKAYQLLMGYKITKRDDEEE